MKCITKYFMSKNFTKFYSTEHASYNVDDVSATSYIISPSLLLIPPNFFHCFTHALCFFFIIFINICYICILSQFSIVGAMWACVSDFVYLTPILTFVILMLLLEKKTVCTPCIGYDLIITACTVVQAVV